MVVTVPLGVTFRTSSPPPSVTRRLPYGSMARPVISTNFAESLPPSTWPQVALLIGGKPEHVAKERYRIDARPRKSTHLATSRDLADREISLVTHKDISLVIDRDRHEIAELRQRIGAIYKTRLTGAG